MGGMTQPESLAIASQASGRTELFVQVEALFASRAIPSKVMGSNECGGCRGAATGRNIHQKNTEEAVRMTAACHAIICEGASVDTALSIFNGVQ